MATVSKISPCIWFDGQADDAAAFYTKVFDGNSGYLSHSLYPLYFGLGAAESIDGIEVQWPSGKAQKVAGPFSTPSCRV